MDNELQYTVSYLISDVERDQRVDLFLASRMEDLTRSRIQRLIKSGLVTVNKQTPKMSYHLKQGDQIEVTIPPVSSSLLEPESVEFSIIHEDSSLLVIDKPPGIVIHPAPGHSKGTLVHGLLDRCSDLSGIGGISRPGIVHRLDKDTSGIMVVAKNDKAHSSLSKQFKARTITKRYITLVHGVLDRMEGEIDLPIGRHPIKRKKMSVRGAGGRNALTLWKKVEEIVDMFSLLVITLKTGRTHQIRVHLSHIGHPIVGDHIYGMKKRWWGVNNLMAAYLRSSIARQMLHAEALGFIHPDTGKYCEFEAPIPEDMESVINCLRHVGVKDKNA